MIEPLTSKLLRGTRHGFLGRRGGVSTGVIAGLNVGVGSGDDPESVAENRRRAVKAVAPGAQLVTPYQVHSAHVVVVDQALPEDSRPHADALVTDRPGLVLGIVTADCAPILLSDRQAGVVGAAHAGWKGALGGIAEATVAAMVAIGADRERIAAVIGPCIAQRSYEVDEAFFARFLIVDPSHERFFVDGTRQGHSQFDLEAFVVHRLAAAGVRQIAALGIDTYGNASLYYSFRRATHAGEAVYGRQISAIAL